MLLRTINYKIFLQIILRRTYLIFYICPVKKNLILNISTLGKSTTAMVGAFSRLLLHIPKDTFYHIFRAVSINPEKLPIIYANIRV